MGIKNINIWYIASFLISLIVAIPIFTVFGSFFEATGNYSLILKNTFLYDYIFNSIYLLIGVLFLTFIIGVGCAYLVSFYYFPCVNFFKWALILSFAVPAYIYAYSLTAFLSPDFAVRAIDLILFSTVSKSFSCNSKSITSLSLIGSTDPST